MEQERELVTFEAECVISEQSHRDRTGGHVAYNARFHLRGLSGDTAPRGVISLTRLPFEPKVGHIYRIRLTAIG